MQTENLALKLQIHERIHQAIVARPFETEQLLAHFDRILEGHGDVCFVVGEAGSGKTTFAEQVVKSLAVSDVNCVYGKFRKHEGKPFSALSEVIENAVKRLLTLPLDQLDAVRKTLRDAVGSDLGFIASLTPYLQKLFPTAEAVSSRAYVIQANQVENVLFDFFLTISDYLFPMILFVDDLQWADRASLNVLECFCRSYQKSDFLLLMTTRAYETEPLQLLESCLSDISAHRIEIKPFGVDQINIFLSQVFDKPMENQRKLARFLHGATLGNPFFIKEMLLAWIDDGAIVDSNAKGRWSANLKAIEAFALLPDVHAILIQKLVHLDTEDLTVLNALACFDGNADYAFLMNIIGFKESFMAHHINKLSENGLITILKSDESDLRTETMLLMHDILVDHLYRKMSSEEKAAIHTRIAEQLIEARQMFYFKKDQLTLTSQIMRADANTLFEDVDRWVVLLYEIGLAVKRMTLNEDALKLFKMCETLLPSSTVNDLHLFEKKVQFELGECEFLLEQYAQADARFRRLMALYHSSDTLIEVKCKYMDLYIYSGRSSEVIDMSREVLKSLDFDLTTANFELEAQRIQQLFSKTTIMALPDAPVVNDQRILYILNILTKIAPVAYLMDNKLFLFIMLKIGEISALHGNSDYAPIGYAGISFVEYNLWKDFENGKRLMQVAIDLLENTSEISTKSIIHFLSGSFLKHRAFPIADTIGDSMKAIDEGLLSGYYVYCGYSITGILNAKYIMGIPLSALHNEIMQYIEKMTWMDRVTLQYIQDTYIQHIRCLKTDASEPYSDKLMGDDNLLSRSRLLTQALFRLQRVYLVGNLSAAIQLTEQIAAADKLLSGTVLYPDILLFSILSRAAMHSQYKQREQQSNLSIMKALLDEFDDWTASYAENHYARMLLAKAAFRHCEQPNERLDHWYNEAIDSAACSGQIQMAALANLLAARYHDKESRLANFYAIEAEHYYAQWGADTISAMIRREFALAGAGVQSEPSNKAPNPKEFPYQKEVPYQEKAPHQKEAPHQKGAPYQEEIPSPGTLNEPLMIDPGSLGEAQRFTYLLDALSKQSRATYAAVLFEKSDRMFLKYEKDFGDAVTCHEELININHVSHLSRRIVRYVARTGEDFMLSENSSRDVVAFDPYILSGESISIVCVPFRQEGILAGLLYFEKKGSDYFEPHFVAQIKSMVSLLILNRPYRDEKTSKAPLPVHAASQLLTGRELDVLALLAEGMSNSEISQNLFITLGTVKNHLSNIYGKLEVESRVQAVIRAKELGIIAD